MRSDKTLFILIIIFLGLVFYGKFRTVSNIPENTYNIQPVNITELSTEGFIQAKVTVKAIYSNVALIQLHAGCYEIDANTDPWVADAIQKGSAGKVNFRPSVYDVIRDAFNYYGVKVLMLKIVDVKNNTFIGRLYLQQGKKIISLDCRPSDGTAIALRTGAKIYIKKSLAEQYGHYIC